MTYFQCDFFDIRLNDYYGKESIIFNKGKYDILPAKVIFQILICNK